MTLPWMTDMDGAYDGNFTITSTPLEALSLRKEGGKDSEDHESSSFNTDLASLRSIYNVTSQDD